MKKPDTNPDIERIFKASIIEPKSEYKEYGSGFIKFDDPQAGKRFIIQVKECKIKNKTTY